MTNKPARLHKKDPITLELNPAIIIAGLLLFLLILILGFGSIENYTILLNGAV